MTTYAQLIDGKLITAPRRVEIDGSVIFNPMPHTLMSLGYKEVVYPVLEEEDRDVGDVTEAYTEDDTHIYVRYVPAEPITDTRTYEERVEALIREQYSMNDELAILRQRDTKPAEFKVYFDYCEECKQKSKI